jgi:hypothetical protein
MTKPMNFPERKRQRQVKALARLKNTRCPANHKQPEIWLANKHYNMAILEEVTAVSKRDIQTKKHRDNRAFSRY